MTAQRDKFPIVGRTEADARQVGQQYPFVDP